MPLPSGTVTFLFTEIEGSTRVWEESPQAMRPALAHHDALQRAPIETSGGHVFKTLSDAFCAVFATAPGARAASLGARRALCGEAWPAYMPPVRAPDSAAPRGVATLRRALDGAEPFR